MIKDGTLPKQPIIGGEVVFSLFAGANLPHVPGKEQFAFQVDLPRFDDSANIMPDKPKTGFAMQDFETMKFSPKIRIKMAIENQNMHIYKDYILVSIFKCDTEE